MSLPLMLRDLEILQAIWTARYMTTPQIQALFWRETKGGQFGALKASQRRLRQLTQAGLLRRIEQPVRRGEGPRPFIYTLDRLGAQVLSQELGIEPDEADWKPKSAEENYPFLQHLLATNDFRIALTLACAQYAFTLETWLDEKLLKSEEMRDYVTVRVGNAEQRIAVVPDGFFVLLAGQRRARCCVEIDRGMVTVSPTLAEQRGWTQKVRAYLEYHASGSYTRRYQSHNLWVLTVTTGERRLLNMKQATEAVGGDFRFWFTTFDQITPAQVLTEPIWYQAGNDARHALLE